MRKRLTTWTALLAVAAGCSEPTALSETTGSSGDPAPPPPPTSVVTLQFVAGDGQILTAGETAPEAFVVEARDSRGMPVPDLAITMRATLEGGLFLPQETQTTSADGRVSYSFEAPPSAVALGIQASAPGASAAFLSVEIHAGPAVSLDVQLDPEAVLLGTAATIQVEGFDRFGNLAELPGLELSVDGSAAILAGATIEGAELGEGMIRAQAGELSDSASFIVYGQLWRRPLSATPLRLRARDNGDFVVLTIDALEVRDHVGLLRLSVPITSVAADVVIDEARGIAYVSLQEVDRNILAIDLSSGVVETWSTGLFQAGKLTYDPVADLLIATDIAHRVCIIPVTTQTCELREAGNLPMASAVDPDIGVVLVPNHTRTGPNFDVTLLYLDGRTSTIVAVSNPLGVAIDTQRHIGVVTNSMGPSVTVVDLAAGRKLGDIETGGRPMDMVLDSESGLAVINHGYGDVAWLDTETLQVVGHLMYPHGHPGIAGSLSDRVVFLTPPYPDLLQLVSLDEAVALPDLRPEGQVVQASEVPGEPYVAVVTSLESGLEVHRLPISSTP
ncbi:MAG: hypothetical protein ABFS14_07975 [Gemmatimonadota bacterium]